jgi:hypothetical protein
LRSFSPPDFAPIRRHPQQPRGSKRMLAVCGAGSKVTEVLAQYAGLSHRPSMTKSGPFHQLRIAGVITVFGSNQNRWCAARPQRAPGHPRRIAQAAIRAWLPVRAKLLAKMSRTVRLNGWKYTHYRPHRESGCRGKGDFPLRSGIPTCCAMLAARHES